jgi:hypothetical protein
MTVKGHSFATLRTWLRITHLVRIWGYLCLLCIRLPPKITNPSRFYHTRGHYPGLMCTTPPLKEVLTPAFFPPFGASLVEIGFRDSPQFDGVAGHSSRFKKAD